MSVDLFVMKSEQQPLVGSPVDGTPCMMKVVRTVWNGGKVSDHLKDLPIVIKWQPNAFKKR